MTKLSRTKLEPEQFGHYVNNLWSAFTLMDSKEDIKLLFKDLFTHTEYKMFAKRLEIARRLIFGQTYEQIKKELKVTAATIANVNNIINQNGDGYRKADEKLNLLENYYKKKRENRQSYVEGRSRRKLPQETLALNLINAGIGFATNKISKTIKKKSANHKLEV